jgi:hypothetical protein
MGCQCDLGTFHLLKELGNGAPSRRCPRNRINPPRSLSGSVKFRVTLTWWSLPEHGDYPLSSRSPPDAQRGAALKPQSRPVR